MMKTRTTKISADGVSRKNKVSARLATQINIQVVIAGQMRPISGHARSIKNVRMAVIHMMLTPITVLEVFLLDIGKEQIATHIIKTTPIASTGQEQHTPPIRVIVTQAIVINDTMDIQHLTVPTYRNFQFQRKSTSAMTPKRGEETIRGMHTECKVNREAIHGAVVMPTMRMETIGDIKIKMEPALEGEDTTRIREMTLSDGRASRMIVTRISALVKRPPTPLVGMRTDIKGTRTMQTLPRGRQVSLAVKTNEVRPMSKTKGSIRRLVTSVHLTVANALLQRGEDMTLINPNHLSWIHEAIEQTSRCMYFIE